MTVREYIKHLQTLDQDKGIWVRYDSFLMFPPIPDAVADAADVKYQTEKMDEKDVKVGDYIIDT